MYCCIAARFEANGGCVEEICKRGWVTPLTQRLEYCSLPRGVPIKNKSARDI